MSKLIIDGNAVYEIDEDCMRRKEKGQKKRKEFREKKPVSEGNSPDSSGEDQDNIIYG